MFVYIKPINLNYRGSGQRDCTVFTALKYFRFIEGTEVHNIVFPLIIIL